MAKLLSPSAKILTATALVGLLSACAVQPKPLTDADLRQQAKDDQSAMFGDTQPLTRPLTLADAIARALKYNLDHRAKMMEKALALGQTKLDRWELLPKVTAGAGYVGRSDHATNTSTNSRTLTPALSDPYYSQDRDRIVGDLGVSWNVLDFGVSYYAAQQNADRALIAEERRRKAVHVLIQEVRTDFYRAAAAQVLEGRIKTALTEGEQALADARQVEGANLKNPAEVLRYQRGLLDNLRQLEQISQELATAKVELAALINLPPGSEFTLAMSDQDDLPLLSLPMALDQMEETAFLNNPDLREQGYAERITIDETRKDLARLLPGISLSASSQYDSNSFLVDNQWYDASARVSWNLINLLSLPDQLDHAEAAKQVTRSKRLALRMAILAQVHVSYRNFQSALRQFDRANQLYRIDVRLDNFSRARTDQEAQSVLERVAGQTVAITSALRRYQTYAQVVQAQAKLYATLGQDLLPPALASTDIGPLADVVATRLRNWDHGELALPAPIPAQSTQNGETLASNAAPAADGK